MVSSLRSGRNVNFRILDVDWCTSDKVILASDDGCIRVLEMSMKPSCFKMDEQELTGKNKSQQPTIVKFPVCYQSKQHIEKVRKIIFILFSETREQN